MESEDAARVSTRVSSGVRESQEIESKTMTVEELAVEIRDTINDVANIVDISPGMCRILLHKFQWQKDPLLGRYYEADNADAFLRQAQVLPKVAIERPNSNIGDCDVCCDTTQLCGLACNHLACDTCWKSYLETKITNGNTSEIQCIASNCQLLIEDEKVLHYVTDPKIRAMYEKLQINSYVEINRLLKWCPMPNCGRAIKVQQFEARPVMCKSCSQRFCFRCAHEWHAPVNCRLLKLWMKKCQDDSETSNWINANTKDCPKCNVTIEKNGGCNHMTCRNKTCGAEFCWICLGEWKSHHGDSYNCNRFNDSNAKNANSAQEQSRAALKKYLHFYSRYTGHQQSLRLEAKLYATVKTKMEQMQQQGMSWIEVQFLPRAVDVLSKCRGTLMYTYAFAYYLKKDNQSMIFEDNQKDLEMATEQLSEFLERDLENENLVTLKQKVQDKCRYVDQRRQILLKYCR
ncbi:hypothetical protein WR25_02617 [Diploscapter pachys]|uniref:RBR-type E3 ubiquitin transferase n=1 Tax=Diploscapter pachys TaxID=2018661 RepID=A0A2A2LW10_9BILA|nr:hypothetical protein WR25_02617 [Diploscapter pachys]